MTNRIHNHLDRGEARIVNAPVAPMAAVNHDAQAALAQHQVENDRNFELPTALYGATVGLYLAFFGVMFAGFGGPGLIIPTAIFVVFVVAGFGVPAIWTRIGNNRSVAMTWGQLKNKGIMTNTGQLSMRDAAIQMLILPVLVVLWGCTTVLIATLV
ncbi:hypothetical protein [Erythrobacter sp. Alg231-14]|uniref:hypothetical protein n=1 Tax=Erythrobacter sp. Alg231-14 TaxID=1922225 RepID=UPI000D55A2CC